MRMLPRVTAVLVLLLYSCSGAGNSPTPLAEQTGIAILQLMGKLQESQQQLIALLRQQDQQQVIIELLRQQEKEQSDRQNMLIALLRHQQLEQTVPPGVLRRVEVPVQPTPPASGRVTETHDAGGYTYARVDAGGKLDWYVAQQCILQVGDEVELPAGAMAMHDFESKTLHKKFEVIYFAQCLKRARGAAAPVQEAYAGPANVPAPPVELQGIARADGGMTVAEIWAQGATGDGKDITVRGKVVKFNADIMGKNWLHIRDGSGTEGSNDINVTTDATVKVGDTVVVKGTLVKDRDFGAGYRYPLMIENAHITVE